jgi:hypothetical protein
MYQNDPQKVLTGKVRLSYVHLTTPRPSIDGSPRYSAVLLIPKTDTATKADIDAAIREAAKAGIAKTWGGVKPPSIHVPLHDGDGVRESGEPYGEECKGCWVLGASTKNKPGIVDSSLSEIIDSTEIYSGMYARATIRFFAYNNSGKKGIGCGLGNILKVADGEPLSGDYSTPAKDFAEVVSSAPARAVPGRGAAAPAVYADIDPITGQAVQDELLF